MYAYIKGRLEEVTEDAVIVEANGIGYQIQVPGAVLDEMPAPGTDVKIYTYLYVREDAFLLYGFFTKDDLYIFKLLISVSGIGPKGALGILSALTPDDLRYAILSEDSKAISKAPGIGAKTAQRLILELKDKLHYEELLQDKEASGVPGEPKAAGMAGQRGEAVMALTALGYSSSDALLAIKKADPPKEADVEEILKAALKQLAFL